MGTNNSSKVDSKGKGGESKGNRFCLSAVLSFASHVQMGDI